MVEGFRIARISENTYLLRLDDTDVRYFEALWEIPEGITYNSYMIDTGEGFLLLDGWKKGYEDLFVEAVRRITDPRDVKWIISHHAEPDHSGTLPAIVAETGGRAEILAHPLGLQMLKSFYGGDFKGRPLKDGEELRLGNLVLETHYTPWLHWPETIMTYYREKGILFSCDVFGTYGIPSGILDSEEDLERIMVHARKYLATVVGHYRRHIAKNLEKLKARKVEPRVIAPSHGPVWASAPEAIVGKYLEWADAAPSPGKVLVVYGSMYGDVEVAVKRLIKILEEEGLETVVYSFTDKHWPSISDIIGDALDASGIVIGAATYEADVYPLIRFIAEELAAKTAAPEKPLAIISSYGWGGVAGKRLSSILGKSFKIIGIYEFRGSSIDDGEIKIIAKKLAGGS